jgi:hypothetical protein
MKPETLETRLLKSIDRKRGDVFLRADFGDRGGYDQVGRALRQLVREGRLVKIGQGLYARSRPSITSGEPVPVGGLSALKESAPPGRGGDAAEQSRAGLQRRAHHAGAGRPGRWRHPPRAPQDRVRRFRAELRACSTRASLTE